jgi:uncharacterized protein
MKILFDTNVYVSESLVGGLAEQIITASRKARFRVYVSRYILDETTRVLTEKFGFNPRFAAAVRRRIRNRCQIATAPESRHRVLDDPNDSPVLKVAIGVGADYLVTDDRHLLTLDRYEGLRIISLKDFATQLRNDGLLHTS